MEKEQTVRREYRLPEQVRELLDQIDDMPPGAAERVLIDQALALARELGDERAEYEVRFRLTQSSVFTGDTDTLLSSFAWCLAKHDADPRQFPNDLDDEAGSDLMWQFKWVTSAIKNSPAFSRTQCEALLDDMQAYYVRNGLGLSGVVTARFQYAWATGDLATAEQLRAEVHATPRDEHSHCDACVRSVMAAFALELGDEDHGLRLVDEIVDGGYACSDEPERALGCALVAMLRAGRTSDALDAHMLSYRLARTNPDNTRIVADNMVFCAITGNEARGLAMVERHIAWLAHDALDEAGQLALLKAVGVVLDAVARAGHGEQVVRGAGVPALHQFFGERDGAWTVATLAPQVWQAADRLGAAFDARNANTYVSQRTAATRALLDERYDVPIASDVFLPPAPAPAQPSTPQRWLDLAEVYRYSHSHPTTVVQAAMTALDAELTAAQEAQATELLISTYVSQDRCDDARALLPRRVAALRAEGRVVMADLEERLGLALHGEESAQAVSVLAAEVAMTGPDAMGVVELAYAQVLAARDDCDLDEVLTLAQSALTRLEADTDDLSPDPDHLAYALFFLSSIHLSRAELSDVADVVDRLVAMDLPDGQRARVLFERAQIMGAVGRCADGLADADEAARIYASYGASQAAVEATMLASALAEGAGRPDESLTRLRYALREAQQADLETRDIRDSLGRALVVTGHPTEGVEVLWQVLKEQEQAEVPPQDRAETCAVLVAGFVGAEEYAGALATGEKAAALWREAGEPGQAAGALVGMATLLREVEMYDESLSVLSDAWDLVKKHDAGAQVRVLEARALTQARRGKRSAVSDIDKAIAIVKANPPGPDATIQTWARPDAPGDATPAEFVQWKVADLTDSKARVLSVLERWDKAVAAFLQAADGFVQAGTLASAAFAEH
ncbi:MAG: hypothetical protein FWE61_09340, partial [Micrococcales bacterium]|nr:hypothetical protein [Micrococcales bacterium]